MNREILFKAKRKSWKELPKEEWWVEGYLFDDGMPEPKHYFIGGIIVKPYEGTACDKEFGTNKEIMYDVVTAWMPKEQIEPYKEK